MIEITEENIIAALQSEHMERTGAYLQDGRRLSEFDLSVLEMSLIEILTQIQEGRSNKTDAAIASWIMIELEIRGKSQEPFWDRFSECVQNLPIDEYSFSIAITDSVEKFLNAVKNKN